MTTLFERGIKAVSALPAHRRDIAGKLLLELASAGRSGYRLTPEQIADLKQAIDQADRGEFASETRSRKVWRDFFR